MRVSRKAVDTDRLAWQQLSDVMYCKPLNGNREEGPHTLLLRSDPREPGPFFGQYHPDDEEFLCLDGDFTFDGSTWFSAGSYAFYPAYFVHGSDVHVRGGYELYLRRSGPGPVFKVNEPLSHIPYYVGKGQSADAALQLVDVANTDGGVKDIAEEGALRLKPLHRDAVTGKGSTLLSAARGAVGKLLNIDTPGTLEIFVLSGLFALADGTSLKARTYHCEVGDPALLELKCKEGGTLVISHDGELRLRTGGKS